MIINFYQKPFPVLDLDDRFYLREQSLEDTEAFFEYYADPDVSQYILATIPTTLADASTEINYCRNLFHQKRGIYWSIANKEDNRMVGAVGLYINNHHHRAEICYDLHKNYWRQGIVTKAIERVMDFAFRHMEVCRIEALTVKENMASIEILKKLGYQHEATLHNYRYFKNQPNDVELLATTPEQQIKRFSQAKSFAEAVSSD